MTILWQGKIGYGDVVSPICYASNRREKLVFVWESSERKMHRDPAWLAADFIAAKHGRPVEVEHLYGTKLHVPHVGYDDSSDMHNVGFMRRERMRDPSGPLAVVDPTRNEAPLPGSKNWKSPRVDWAGFRERHDAVLVDYRTPIAEAVAALSEARLCVGYHGSASWLARWVGVPQIVVSEDPGGITSRSFRQAAVVSELPDDEKLAELAELAESRLIDVRVRHGI